MALGRVMRIQSAPLELQPASGALQLDLMLLHMCQMLKVPAVGQHDPFP